MAMFDFSEVSSSQARLEPGIHEVTFDGVDAADFPAKEGSGKIYKTLRFKFSKGSATFTHTLFEPREEDFKRTTSKVKNKNGEEVSIPQPSEVDSMMLFIKSLIGELDPEFAKKIDSKEVVFGGSTWDELRNNVVKVLNRNIGKKISIKLIPDKNGEARFPRFFAAVGKDGKAYIRNRFIGNSLSFTPYEKSLFKDNKAEEDEDSFDYIPGNTEAAGDLDFDLNL